MKAPKKKSAAEVAPAAPVLGAGIGMALLANAAESVAKDARALRKYRAKGGAAPVLSEVSRAVLRAEMEGMSSMLVSDVRRLLAACKPVKS